MFKRVLFLVLAVLVIVVALGGVAAAWTPQDIYDDYAQNGKLTRDYTDAELNAYLNDPTIDAYPPDLVIKSRLDSLVTSMVSRDEFPFTGFQLLLMSIAVAVMVGGGVALRLFARPRKTSANS